MQKKWHVTIGINVMQMKVQNNQLHVQALEEKQKIRHFWRKEVLEGQ